MPKRKAGDLDHGGLAAAAGTRRSSRTRSVPKPKPSPEPTQMVSAVKKATGSKSATKTKESVNEKTAKAKKSKPQEFKEPTDTSRDGVNPASNPPTARQYWLMKAEPESRLEKGHDIKFSIDDLAAKKKPEPWDGIRAYPARNNLRGMKKSDLAFFYHSSCKVPAIVGIMEIVEEHTPDFSAHDPAAPYYDPKSNPEDPKWSLVHVAFKQKLDTPITLQELKAWHGEKGNALAEMQMLKLGRLSVSKVSEGEWKFLIEEMRKRGDVVEL